MTLTRDRRAELLAAAPLLRGVDAEGLERIAARTVEVADGVPVVTLATAHPAKFRDAVERATGVRPALPHRIGSLFEREERCDLLPAELGAVEAYVAARATPRRA